MIDRREFVKSIAILTSASSFDVANFLKKDDKRQILINSIDSNFERERLIAPFGFKGNYLTELWQTVSQVKSSTGHTAIGIATQSVLYADSDLFISCTEAEGNALMYLTVNKALQLIKSYPFYDPINLMDSILPKLHSEAKRITQKENLNINFVYNALVGVDNAVWLLYAKENGFTTFDDMLPPQYKAALSHQNKRVAVMCPVSYGTSMHALRTEVENGYFVIKIKIGAPGTQEEMLKSDMKKLSEIHEALRNYQTSQTKNGKLIYTLDANGRYEKKATFVKYLEHAKSIGAFDQILLCEEPFIEDNNEYVGNLDLIIAADESIHDETDALRKIEQGYQAFVLKGIAKTLSQTLKIAKLAYEKNIPCICADLTVNPILIDWNKNLASRLTPFPGLKMGLMETNGDINYKHWENMKTYHPYAGVSWLKVRNGVYELNNDFFNSSGGIYKPSNHYKNFFNKNK